jgi:hypothetical protein
MMTFWKKTAEKFLRHGTVAVAGAVIACAPAAGRNANPAPSALAPDVLVLSNGDTLHGKLVKEVGGKVTFHTDSLGDVDVAWDKIAELHSAEKFGVLDKTVKLRGKKGEQQISVGTLDVAGGSIEVHPENAVAPAPIAVKNAAYIVDTATLEKQIHREPRFLSGWNGAATAGATVVKATQNQYTISGGVGLSRVVPTVSWLTSRNRTLADFSGSYGKLVQPAYTSGGVVVPATETKSAIFHLDGERDEYFSPRLYVLAQTAFDHNFAQDLQLQQIFGGGLGWTLFSTPRHQADMKGTVQYEKQSFINGTPGTNQNLVGSTFAANYILHMKKMTYLQGVSFIPAYNMPRAYSAAETDTVTFPAFKNLGFSVGTLDTYLNDAPVSTPPTRRNSFQFTMGLTYAVKSKY